MPGNPNYMEPVVTASTPGAVWEPQSGGPRGDVGHWRMPTVEESAAAKLKAQQAALPANIQAAITSGQLIPQYSMTSTGNGRNGAGEVASGIASFTSPGPNDTTYTYDAAGNKTGQFQNQHGGGGFFDRIFSGVSDFIADPSKATTNFFENPGVKEAAIAAAMYYGIPMLAEAAGAGAAGAGTLGAAEGALTAAEIAALPGLSLAEAGTFATLGEMSGALSSAEIAQLPGLTGLTGAGANMAALTPAALESLVGTAGYGLNASALDAAIAAGINPAIVGAGATGIAALPTAAELVASGTTSGGTLPTALGNEAVASGMAPGSLGAAANAAGVLTPTQLAAAAGTGGLGALTGADALAAKLAASSNEAVASGLSPGSVGAAQAAAGTLTAAELAAAAGTLPATTGIPNVLDAASTASKAKSLYDKLTGSAGTVAGGLGLAALLASLNKGQGTDDSYKGTIPEFTASRTQMPLSDTQPSIGGKPYRPGQGGITYFSPITYSPSAQSGFSGGFSEPTSQSVQPLAQSEQISTPAIQPFARLSQPPGSSQIGAALATLPMEQNAAALGGGLSGLMPSIAPTMSEEQYGNQPWGGAVGTTRPSYTDYVNNLKENIGEQVPSALGGGLSGLLAAQGIGGIGSLVPNASPGLYGGVEPGSQTYEQYAAENEQRLAGHRAAARDSNISTDEYIAPTASRENWQKSQISPESRLANGGNVIGEKMNYSLYPQKFAEGGSVSGSLHLDVPINSGQGAQGAYPSVGGGAYPSRENNIGQGGIVPQGNLPQLAGLGALGGNPLMAGGNQMPQGQQMGLGGLYGGSAPSQPPAQDLMVGGSPQQNTMPQEQSMGLPSAQSLNMANGGSVPGQYNLGSYSDGGRLLKGPGDGVSDSIPAIIGQKQPARLATGEFVVPARIVSELGNGSTEAGAQRLYEMMKRVQQTRRKTKNVAANTNAAKYLPA